MRVQRIIIAIFVISGMASLAEGQTMPTDYDTCAHLKQWESANPQPGDGVIAQEQYDTLRLYIERCAKDYESYLAFNSLDGAVQLSSSDLSRFDTYRDWLISVLNLNTTDPIYFCACVMSMAMTYQYGTLYYNIPNASLAVLMYLRNNPNCGGPGLDQDIKNSIDYRHRHWLEGDTTKPENTWIPRLDSIGLGVLLNHQAVAPSSGQLLSQYLASFTSSPNPFIKETTLQFILNRMTYTTVAVYDELGRLVWGDGRGASLEAGEHTIHLDGKSLPSGTLYARISTGFGEVKTVKLIHE